MQKEIKDLVDDVKDYLEYHKMMGITEVPMSASRQAGRSVCHSRQGGRLKGSPLTAAEMAKELANIRAEIGDCKRCRLCKGRTNIVFGVGNPCAELMFVGEGPGADEDAKGEPFVGRAGQLLTKIINAMGLKREDVYIGNCVKCRPPENRNPEPDELESCMPFIYRQIAVIRPKIIVALGAVAAKAMLRTETPISKLRGRLLDWPPDGGEFACKLLPTYHPAFLLRNPAMKKPVWEDMQVVMKELGLKSK